MDTNVYFDFLGVNRTVEKSLLACKLVDASLTLISCELMRTQGWAISIGLSDMGQFLRAFGNCCARCDTEVLTIVVQDMILRSYCLLS